VEVRATENLAGSEYSYACEVAIPPSEKQTAQSWAREIFEGAPAGVRQFIVAGWIGALGVRLAPRSSPDHVLGWPIAHATDEMIVLEAPFRFGTARNVVLAEPSRVVLTTFVRYEKPLARATWSGAALLHERIIPYLMNHAVRSRASSTSSGLRTNSLGST
jgi:hypothetical protein